MADYKLFLYNSETNQIGYIDWLYEKNATGTTAHWTGNGFSLDPTFTRVPANMNFLSDPNNKWCFVRSSTPYRMYRLYRPEVVSTRYTLPGFYYADDNKIYYNTLDKGASLANGSFTVTVNLKTEWYYNGSWHNGTAERVLSSAWCLPTWSSTPPLHYTIVSNELKPADANLYLAQIRAELTRYSEFYINRYGGGGKSGCLSVSCFLGHGTNVSNYLGVVAMLPNISHPSSLGSGTGVWPIFSSDNQLGFEFSTNPSTYSIQEQQLYSYDSALQSLPSVVQEYINANFGGVAPEDIGELPQDILDPTSIYTPGGDTSGDPYNPYPGGSSGSNPGTNDPLNSGTDTTSTSTPGTWELPFDEVPDTPATVHSVDLGLYNVYALSAAQVRELANYLFSGITELGENLVKLIWGSKRDVIISLYEFPLMITNQGTDTIRFIFDTDLAGLFHGKQLTSEYIPIDFGTIKVDRYSGTFYDFEPYTTLTLYIPYIGYIDLKPTEVVGSTLSIRGYVHLTTGELNVNVRSSRTGILGSYSGTIGRMLPIADADATEIYSSIIKTAASLGAVALAGAGMATASRAAAGISAPNKQTVDSARDTYMQSVGAWGSAKRGVRGLEASMLQAQGSYEKAQADYAEQAGKYNTAQSAVRANREDFHDSASDAISNSLDAVTTGFGVSRGTVMTSSNGRVSPQRCFLRIEVPHQNVSRQQKILGYPANTSDALNSDRLHGYTELRTIELSIPNATLTEIQELEDILRGGFYLP